MFSALEERIIFFCKQDYSFIIRERHIVKRLVKGMMIGAMMALSVPMICAAEDANETADAAAATVTIQTVTPEASDSQAASWLEPAEGEWYSIKGNLVMTVQGSTINGCAVTADKGCTYDYPRTGHFQVTESEGQRSMKLDLLGHKSHQYLIVDDNMPLRRSVQPEYNESIGGIYIGMPKADLEAAYQQPDTVKEDQGMERWAYGAHHMDVYLQGGIVMAIRMYKGSDLKFDKSGLTAESTAETYAQTYGLESTPSIPSEAGVVSTAYKLPQGEYLRFGENFVQLDVM